MTTEEFERNVAPLVAPNEREHFELFKVTIPEDRREAFLALLLMNNTVLTAFRAMDDVADIGSRFGMSATDVLLALPRYIQLYCILKLNKIELGGIKELPKEYSLESLHRQGVEMMEEIR